jgi:hypothetical protein
MLKSYLEAWVLRATRTDQNSFRWIALRSPIDHKLTYRRIPTLGSRICFAFKKEIEVIVRPQRIQIWLHICVWRVEGTYPFRLEFSMERIDDFFRGNVQFRILVFSYLYFCHVNLS